MICIVEYYQINNYEMYFLFLVDASTFFLLKCDQT
jgi:hypothetical protein